MGDLGLFNVGIFEAGIRSTFTMVDRTILVKKRIKRLTAIIYGQGKIQAHSET